MFYSFAITVFAEKLFFLISHIATLGNILPRITFLGNLQKFAK